MCISGTAYTWWVSCLALVVKVRTVVFKNAQEKKSLVLCQHWNTFQSNNNFVGFSQMQMNRTVQKNVKKMYKKLELPVYRCGHGSGIYRLYFFRESFDETNEAWAEWNCGGSFFAIDTLCVSTDNHHSASFTGCQSHVVVVVVLFLRWGRSRLMYYIDVYTTLYSLGRNCLGSAVSLHCLSSPSCVWSLKRVRACVWPGFQIPLLLLLFFFLFQCNHAPIYTEIEHR